VLAEELPGEAKIQAPSIKEMKRLEIADNESASDSGNHRMYPNGQLMFNLIKDWQERIAKYELGAMEIGSPLFYNKADEQILAQCGSFHERHYSVKVPDDPNKEFILRFAADFGLFKMIQQASFSYKQLPLRFFEYSSNFRYEKSGELSGLKRDRFFHMADIHCFCKDEAEAIEEYKDIFKKYENLNSGMGIKYANVLRIVDDFYAKFKSHLLELVKYANRPLFIEKLDKMKHYWAMKHEWQSIDSVHGNQQLSTVQFDVKEGKVYNIVYSNEKGEKEHCIIIHSSVGAVERCMYAILEEALKLERPVLPLWLSPSQLRIIPVNNNIHLDFCSNLSFENIRYDVDDREEKLGKKLIRARSEWIPYVVVVGDNEINGAKFKVNDRLNNEVYEMSKQELEEFVLKQIKPYPFRPLALSKFISKRPSFYGAL
jgi:threonyl-tRNA synthetase